MIAGEPPPPKYTGPKISSRWTSADSPWALRLTHASLALPVWRIQQDPLAVGLPKAPVLHQGEHPMQIVHAAVQLVGGAKVVDANPRRPTIGFVESC